MKAKGLRLPPSLWRHIEQLAEANKRSPSEWIRLQLEALLSRAADLPDTQENGRVPHESDTLELE